MKEYIVFKLLLSEIYKNNIQVKTMQEHENPKILNGRKCVKLKEKKN